jgi:hypothetical protein
MTDRQTLHVLILIVGLLISTISIKAGSILLLSWSYPYNTNNIVFEVWSTTNIIQSFQLNTVTPDLSITIDATITPASFYKVRAKNTITGETGGWATTGH